MDRSHEERNRTSSSAWTAALRPGRTSFAFSYTEFVVTNLPGIGLVSVDSRLGTLVYQARVSDEASLKAPSAAYADLLRTVAALAESEASQISEIADRAREPFFPPHPYVERQETLLESVRCATVLEKAFDHGARLGLGSAVELARDARWLASAAMTDATAYARLLPGMRSRLN